MIDPLQAVTQQNVEALRHALDSGWNPPRLNHKNSGVLPDFSVWTECIMRDWAEGLALLNTSHPSITCRMEHWETALGNGSVNCMALLWDWLKLAEKLTDQTAVARWNMDVMVAFGEPWSLPHEIKDTFPVVQFLTEKNVPTDRCAPGEFSPGDLRLAGHSLWTRCVMLKKWDHVHALWPTVLPDPINSWPRLSETLLHLIEIVVGDYKPLMTDHHNDRLPEEDVLFRWLQDFRSEWILSPSSPSPDPDDVPPSLLHMIARPGREKIAPWLRLPMVVSSGKRNLLWEIWAELLARDPNASWLHELAMYPDDHDVRAIMALAEVDRPAAFLRYWSAPSAYRNGVSAHQQWINLGGDPDIVAWCSNPAV